MEENKAKKNGAHKRKTNKSETQSRMSQLTIRVILKIYGVWFAGRGQQARMDSIRVMGRGRGGYFMTGGGNVVEDTGSFPFCWRFVRISAIEISWFPLRPFVRTVFHAHLHPLLDKVCVCSMTKFTKLCCAQIRGLGLVSFVTVFAGMNR